MTLIPVETDPSLEFQASQDRKTMSFRKGKSMFFFWISPVLSLGRD